MLGSLLLGVAPALAFHLDGTISKHTTPTPLRFSDFDWHIISPTSDLQYHDCYDGVYRCARLSVPLDWSNTSDPRRAAIAVMKLPAAVPDDDPAFGGSIYTNPGGPGHSGVAFLPRVGHLMQQVLDKPGEKHYEIVSFDPRGLGFTTPLADCFGDNVFAKDELVLEVRGTEGLAGGRASLTYNRALHEANAKRCMAVDETGDSIFEYLGTPSVVRDMVEMLDRTDELRKKEQAEKGNDWSELKKRSSGSDDDIPRLQYLGFSYGTVLGNYFASMYPGRVHRMLLDSVCDVNDYASGPGWMTNVADLDTVFEQFLRGCHDAGPKKCAVAREGDSSWTDVEDRVWSFIHGLDEDPRSTLDDNGYGIIVRGRDYRDMIGVALYSPIRTFKWLAVLLDQGIKGNIEFLTNTLPLIPNLGLECSLPGSDDGSNKTMTEPIEADAMEGVLCADGEDVSQKDISYWMSYVEKMHSISKVWGDRWAEVRFPCSRWPFTNKFRFNGPFGTPEPASPDSRPSANQPSVPLLLFSNRFDPVTPVGAAKRMSALHPGSTVVVKESMGHGALVGAKSECLNAVAREYLDTGFIPEEGTVCEAECGPWDDDCKGVLGTGSSVFSREYLEPTLQQRRRFPLGV